MRFGRSANQSNIVAVFMLQPHRPIPEMKKAAGIFALRPPGSKYIGLKNVRSASPRFIEEWDSFVRVWSRNGVPAEEYNGCCETETRLRTR